MCSACLDSILSPLRTERLSKAGRQASLHFFGAFILVLKGDSCSARRFRCANNCARTQINLCARCRATLSSAESQLCGAIRALVKSILTSLMKTINFHRKRCKLVDKAEEEISVVTCTSNKSSRKPFGRGEFKVRGWLENLFVLSS